MRSFLNDPSVPKLHPQAFSRLQDFNVHIGYLRLKTPARVKAAIDFLRGLDLKKVHDQLPPPESFKHLPPPAGSDSLPPPVTVGLFNLIAAHKDCFVAPGQPWDFSQCRTLFVEVVDLSSGFRLKPFRHALRALMNDAGFLDKHEVRGPVMYPHHRFLDLTAFKKLNPKKSVLLEREDHSLATFDATEVMKKYRNWRLTEPFPLERLCIAQRGRPFMRDVSPVRGRSDEIISVPLPWSTVNKPPMNKLQGRLTLAELAKKDLKPSSKHVE